MESKLEHIVREMEKQVEELKISSAEWKAAGLLAKYSEAQKVLGPLEAKIRKLRDMQGGGTPAPRQQQQQQTHAEKKKKNKQQQQQKKGGAASSSSSSGSCVIGCSTMVEKPRGDDPGQPDGAGGGAMPNPPSPTAPLHEAQSSSYSGHWRVTLAAPDVSSASEVEVEEVGPTKLEVSLGGSASPLALHVPGGMDTSAIRVKFSRKQKTLTLTMPRVSFQATARACVEGLNARSHTVVDGFLEDSVASGLLEWVRKQQDDGVLKAGEVEGGLQTKTRGDMMAWISPREGGAEELQALASRLDDLLLEMADACDELASSSLIRDKAMVTMYPGNGARYVKHFDNAGSANKSRVLTCILYLNPGWRPGHGGQLRVFPKGAEAQDVEPLHNRLAMFWSDHRAAHEVLASHRERFAVSFWFHNGVVMKEMHDAEGGEGGPR